MSIAEKLLTVANNTPAVAQAVNATKATITGSSVRADDVLDVEHPLEIQLSSRNLLDISIIGWDEAHSYVQYDESNNTILVQGTRTATTGLGTGKLLCEFAPALEVGKTYFLQGTPTLSNRNYIYLKGYNASWWFGKALKITEVMLNSDVFFYTDAGVDNVISELMISEGGAAVPYVPYSAELEGTEVKACGKNLADPSVYITEITKSVVAYMGNGVLHHIGKTTGSGGTSATTGTTVILQELCPNIQAGKTYILNATTTCESKKYIYLSGTNKVWSFGTAFTITEANLTDKVLWYAAGDGVEVFISDIQIELSSAATDYEPYKEPQTAVADATGKVTGLMPVSPSMTLVSDHTVECTYFPASAQETYEKYCQLRQKQLDLKESLEEITNV